MSWSVLIIGGGGREHAIVRQLFNNDPGLKIYAAPGNPGIAKVATCVDIDVKDIAALTQFAENMDIDLTIVGPEGPLGLGIVDAFRQAGLIIFGPTKEQAQLELSKAYAKEILNMYDIPTAAGQICDSFEKAIKAVSLMAYPVVVKPDGCTEGKGVKICYTKQEAVDHIKAIMVDHIYQKTGDSGEVVVLEEYLRGREASITIITDGTNYLELPTSEDHKKLLDGDGDQNPMTGGMGAYSPSPYADAWAEEIRSQIIEPLIKAVKKQVGEYRGVLYIALMITKNGPKVIEINCRFGDPETQVILPLVQNNLLDIFLSAALGGLITPELEISPYSRICIAAVSEGYPNDYEKGFEITGLNEAENIIGTHVIQAGTKKENGKLVTNGGRVLYVVGTGLDISKASEHAYKAMEKIKFQGKFSRGDIGQRPGQPELLLKK